MEVCPDDGARLIETDIEDTGDPLIGTVFDGRFQILGKLGEGGMGTVYSARRLDFETEVALKLLKLDFARDDGIRKRFMYEARVISNLKHPHAVQLYDFGQTSEGHVYMVMELLSGESLADRLSYRFVTYREVFDIIPPICGVLHEAHLRDVIHRDLKPENIFLLEVEGNAEFPKLLDFGIAKHKREETMTKSGTLWGTPAYMSPEQARGASVGAPADIYGVGIMIFELISGNLPFHASTQMGYAVRHINEPPRPLSSIPGLDSVPPELDDFILSMLAKSPSDRPATMDEVARSLKRIRDEHFDDALLDTKPAEEVDAIALQRWIQEAPEISRDSLEIPPQVKQRAKELDDEGERGLRSFEEMDTLAATDSSLELREEPGETRRLDEEQALELADATRAGLTWSQQSLVKGAALGFVAFMVAAAVVIFVSSPDDPDAGDDREAQALTADLPIDESEGAPVGTVEVPATAGNVAAVGASRAMVVVLEAYGVVRYLEPGVGEDPDFEFLNHPPAQVDEQATGEEEDPEVENLREALERTF